MDLWLASTQGVCATFRFLGLCNRWFEHTICFGWALGGLWVSEHIDFTSSNLFSSYKGAAEALTDSF